MLKSVKALCQKTSLVSHMCAETQGDSRIRHCLNLLSYRNHLTEMCLANLCHLGSDAIGINTGCLQNFSSSAFFLSNLQQVYVFQKWHLK